MKTKYFLIILSLFLLLGTLPMQAQLNLRRQVVAPAGDLMRGPTLIMSATVGETATLPLGNPNLQLTQGFQQPWTLIGTPVAEILDPEPSMAVYPNPTSGEVWIELPKESDLTYTILLTDMLGRPVDKEVTVLEGEGLQRFSLNLTSLPSGLYLVSVRSGEEVEVRKVEKQ